MNLVKNRKGEMVERRTWLKELRNEKGVTIRKAAQDLGISFPYYADIENNRRTPSLENAVKISQYFGFKVDKFIS